MKKKEEKTNIYKPRAAAPSLPPPYSSTKPHLGKSSSQQQSALCTLETEAHLLYPRAALS